MAALLLYMLSVLTLYTSCTSGQKQHKVRCPYKCMCTGGNVYCVMMDLTRLPRRLPVNATLVQAQDNLLRRLRYQHMRRWTTVRHLRVQNNDIYYIEQGAFRDMPRLLSLNLEGNKLRKLHAKTFRGLNELHILSMKQNRVRDIEKVFSYTPSLQLLNMGENHISKITHQTFAYNWQLQVLDMHDNRIQHIHRHAFRAMPFLKYLVLRDNPLKSLSLDFQTNLHLELLDLTGCQLCCIPSGLPHSINDLRLSENKIRTIGKRDFRTTRKVRLLVLNHNLIDSIHDNALTRLSNLYNLYVGKNKLTALPLLPRGLHGVYANYNNVSRLLPHKFVKNANLQNLNLKHNNLEWLSADELEGLHGLRSLDISFNHLFQIKPMAFKHNKRLERLDLSNNPIYMLRNDALKGLENLHILQLSSVMSDDHPKPTLFQDMKSLMFLDISNSSRLARGMAENPYMLDYLYNVQDLNLMNDQLYNLPQTFPNYFPYLRIIKLIGNPWHCDKSILWLIHWMRNVTVEFFAPNFMQCATPPELEGRQIISLDVDELPEASHTTPWKPSTMMQSSSQVTRRTRSVTTTDKTTTPPTTTSTTLTTTTTPAPTTTTTTTPAPTTTTTTTTPAPTTTTTKTHPTTTTPTTTPPAITKTSQPTTQTSTTTKTTTTAPPKKKKVPTATLR